MAGSANPLENIQDLRKVNFVRRKVPVQTDRSLVETARTSAIDPVLGVFSQVLRKTSRSHTREGRNPS
jgi:hypothetical protein